MGEEKTYFEGVHTINNDFVQPSKTKETLVFSRKHSIKVYDGKTETALLLNGDGSEIDFAKFDVVPRLDSKDIYLRVEALLPGLILIIPDIAQVKIVDVQRGHLFSNRMLDHSITTLEVNGTLLEDSERDMNVWVVTLDRDLYKHDDATVCKSIYNWFGVKGATTVDFNDEKLLIIMNQEIFDRMQSMTSKNVVGEDDLTNMFDNKQGAEWTFNTLNYFDEKVSDMVASGDVDVKHMLYFYRKMLKDAANNKKKFGSTAATRTSAGGYSIFGNNLKVFLSNKGYVLPEYYARSTSGAFQVHQILDIFLGKDRMDGQNNIIQLENTSNIALPNTNYTKMIHAWDSAFGLVWGALPDATTMKTGISNKGKMNSSGIYGDLYDVNMTDKNKGIAQQLFDSFVRGRSAIINNDYLSRNVEICVIRRLLSRVLLEKASEELNNAIDLSTQVGTLNAPSPNRILHASRALGYLMALTYTHKEYNYLKIYDVLEPFITKKDLLDAGVLVNNKQGNVGGYDFGKSVWELLDINKKMTELKTFKLMVDKAILENQL